MSVSYQNIKDQLLDASLDHVPFDGWSEATFQAAVRDAGIDPTMAKAVCPRGAVGLAIAYHHRGDALMLERLKVVDLTEMRFRDRIAAAVQFRLEAVGDKEAVRRGTTLFALPTHAADGAKLIWGTVDAIWTALGDTLSFGCDGRRYCFGLWPQKVARKARRNGDEVTHMPKCFNSF